MHQSPNARRFVLLIAALSLFVAALTPQFAAAGAPAEPGPGDRATAQEIFTILGGTVPLADLGDGVYSPDHSRIVFKRRGPSIWTPGQLDPALWAVRADGTQAEELTVENGSPNHPTSIEDPIWVSNTTVRWRVSNPYWHGGNVYEWKTVTSPAAPVDVWAPTPDQQRGFLVLDGRFLVEETLGNLQTGTRVWVTEIATGERHLLLSYYGLDWHDWHEACDLVDGVGTGPSSVIDALSGPNPICDFSRPVPGGPEATTGTATTPETGTAQPLASTPVIPAAAPAQQSLAEKTVAKETRPVELTAVGNRLNAARKRGLTVRVLTSGAATVKVWLLDRRTGKAFGRASAEQAGAGEARLKLKLSGLGGRRTVRATVRVAATDAAGQRTTVVRAVTLSR